jgi:hypothetical protein
LRSRIKLLSRGISIFGITPVSKLSEKLSFSSIGNRHYSKNLADWILLYDTSRSFRLNNLRIGIDLISFEVRINLSKLPNFESNNWLTSVRQLLPNYSTLRVGKCRTGSEPEIELLERSISFIIGNCHSLIDFINSILFVLRLSICSLGMFNYGNPPTIKFFESSSFSKHGSVLWDRFLMSVILLLLR